MKKLKLLILLLIGSTTLSGQVNYYEGKDTLHFDNEIYRISQDDTFIYFRNIKNTKTEQLFYLDGTPVPREDIIYKIENNGETKGLHKAARETFSLEELTRLSDDYVSIHYFVIPDGTITDIEFAIPKRALFYSIPTERWAVLERKIKEYERFELSGAEKYQFVAPGGYLHFKKIYNE